MDQYREYLDERFQQSGCIYCGEDATTREHVPSRVFLEKPYPENLPVVDACEACNNGFSQDEAYVACLLGSAMCGSADPDHVTHASARKLLRRWPSLRARLENARFMYEGNVVFGVEMDRLNRILIKLARGHARYELGVPFCDEPSGYFWKPRGQFSAEDCEEFESLEVIGPIDGVGNRQVQRFKVLQLELQSPSGEKKSTGIVINDWLDVQDGNYSYQVRETPGSVEVRMVIMGYLAAQVSWIRT
jgi:hypothetical protein